MNSRQRAKRRRPTFRPPVVLTQSQLVAAFAEQIGMPLTAWQARFFAEVAYPARGAITWAGCEIARITAHRHSI